MGSKEPRYPLKLSAKSEMFILGKFCVDSQRHLQTPFRTTSQKHIRYENQINKILPRMRKKVDCVLNLERIVICQTEKTREELEQRHGTVRTCLGYCN